MNMNLKKTHKISQKIIGICVKFGILVHTILKLWVTTLLKRSMAKIYGFLFSDFVHGYMGMSTGCVRAQAA